MKSKIKYYFATIPIILLAIYFAYIVAISPYFHAEMILKKQGDFVITDVGEDGEANKLGIKKDDIILKINEEKPGNYFIFKKLNTVEQVKTIEFKQGTEIKTATITQNYTQKEILLYLIFPSIVFLTCLILGYLVMRQNDRSRINKLFLFFLLTLGLGYISAGASSRGDLPARIVASISFILAPVVLLNLLFTIFESLNIKQNWKPIIKALNITSIGLIGVVTIHESSNLYYSQIHKLQLTFFFFVITFSICILIMTYFKKMDPEARTTIKVLFSGVFLAFSPFLLLHALPFLLFNSSFLDPEFTLIFLLILPITIIYLILKERFVDIDFILALLRRNFLYSSLAGIFFYTFSLLNYDDKAALNSITVAIICLIIFSFKNRFSLKSTSNFNQSNQNLQRQLNEYFEKSKNDSSPSKLLEMIISEIQIIIPKIKTIEHFYLQRKINQIEMTNGTIQALIEPYIELLVKNQPSIGTITNLKDGFCILIHEKEDSFFYLFCDYKIDRTNLNPVEKSWLETLANYSNVLLTNQYTIENVVQQLSNLKKGDVYHSRWLSKLLLSFSENERVRLASDLHDSILQELLVVNNELESVLNSPLSDEDYAQIDEIKERVLDCVHTTRETCTELSPPLLVEFGLTQAIKNLIKKVHLRSDYEVFFNFETFHDDSLSEEHVITLYRIIQELFTNAMKHSKADEVTLTLENTDDQVILFYSDNGVGLKVVDLYSEDINYGGLIGSKERARNLDGTFELGHVDGLQITIHLPLEAKPFTYQDIIQ